MAEAAFDLQRKMKGNVQEIQDYLTQLYRWEDEIKVKDEDMKIAAQNFKPDHKFPVRSKKTVNDSKEEPSNPVRNSSNLHDKQQALLEKNKGNDFFKEGKFEQAVSCYSTAIGLDSTDAILPANRAIALIKLNRFKEAEEDCNTSLTLDPTFVKAYHRRGTARFNLGKLDLAKKDFEKVLSLEPHNKAAQIELEKVMRHINDAGQSSPAQTSIKSERSIIREASSNPEETEKGSSSGEKRELKNEKIKNSAKSYIIEEYFEPSINPVSEVSSQQHVLPIIAVPNETQEEIIIEKIVRELETVRQPTAPETSAKIFPDFKPEQVPPIPKTYFQFSKDWKRLDKYTDLRFQYLKQIPPSSLPEMFRESLETDVLGSIISTLKNEFIARDEPLLPWLASLSRTKRIGAVVMFLAAKEKSDLAAILDYIENKNEGSKEERECIRLKLS